MNDTNYAVQEREELRAQLKSLEAYTENLQEYAARIRQELDQLRAAPEVPLRVVMAYGARELCEVNSPNLSVEEAHLVLSQTEDGLKILKDRSGTTQVAILRNTPEEDIESDDPSEGPGESDWLFIYDAGPGTEFKVISPDTRLLVQGSGYEQRMLWQNIIKVLNHDRKLHAD